MTTTSTSHISSNNDGQAIVGAAPGYQAGSLYGTDYFCPKCWDEDHRKTLMFDVVVKQKDGSEIFDGVYCEYCLDVRKKGGEYNPATENLEAYKVGGSLGYPDEEEG